MGVVGGGAAARGNEFSPGQWRAMVDSVADAMLAIDARGRVLFANAAVERMFGYANREVVGHNVRLLMPEPDRSAHDGYLHDYLRNGIAKVIGVGREVTARRKDGSEFPASLVVSEYAGTEAGAPRFIGTLRDVSDRAAAERERRRFFEMSTDLLCVAGTDGYFKKLNPAWPRTFGYTEKELLAHPYLDLVHPDDRTRTEQEAAALLDAGHRTVDFENRYRCKDGTYKWLHWTSVADPGTGRIFAAARDITRMKEKTEERLREAQRLEAIGQLAGGIAHDFNNLMTVVLGNLQLLEENADGNATALAWAQSGIRAVDRGRSLTKRLLAFSRRQMLRPRAVDLNEQVSGVVEMLERTLGEHVDIRLCLADELWPCVVDPDELDHALTNLAINARDAMAESGTLTLETVNRSLGASYAPGEVAPGDYVVVAVTDTGTGIPHEIVSKIFDPFFTTKAAGVGTGLGLSMVYGFVKQSGGYLSVYSEVGQGTTFRLHFPRSAAPAEAAEVAAENRAPGEERILVVEDDADLRATAVVMLGRIGYSVLEAHDGPSAIAMLERHPEVDLVFTDMAMPGGMSGADVARSARGLRPDIRVLYTSGYAERALAQKAAKDRRVTVLSKPYSRQELAAAIRTALDRGATA